MKFHNKYRILNQNLKQTVETRRKIHGERGLERAVFSLATQGMTSKVKCQVLSPRREQWNTETSQTEHTQAATTQTRCILLMQEQLFGYSICFQPMYTPIPTRSNNEERFKYANP